MSFCKGLKKQGKIFLGFYTSFSLLLKLYSKIQLLKIVAWQGIYLSKLFPWSISHWRCVSQTVSLNTWTKLEFYKFQTNCPWSSSKINHICKFLNLSLSVASEIYAVCTTLSCDSNYHMVQCTGAPARGSQLVCGTGLSFHHQVTTNFWLSVETKSWQYPAVKSQSQITLKISLARKPSHFC